MSPGIERLNSPLRVDLLKKNNDHGKKEGGLDLDDDALEHEDQPSLSSIPNSEKKAAAGLKARFGEESHDERVDPNLFEK